MGLDVPYLKKVQEAPGRAVGQGCAAQSWQEQKGGGEKIKVSENRNWCNGPSLGVYTGEPQL